MNNKNQIFQYSNTILNKTIKKLGSENTGLKYFILFSIIYGLKVFRGFFYQYNSPVITFCIISSFIVLVFYKPNFKISKKTQKYTIFFIWLLFISRFCQMFYQIGNHSFVHLYVFSSLILCYYWHNNKDIFKKNIALIISITLTFAGIQKYVALGFTSGDYYFYMLSVGDFFDPLQYFLTEKHSSIITQNEIEYDLFCGTNPNIEENNIFYFRKLHPNINGIAILLSWLVIGLEIITGLLFLIFPFRKITHISYLLLIIGVFLARQEGGFLSLLCIMGMFTSPDKNITIGYALLTSFIISCIIVELAYH